MLGLSFIRVPLPAVVSWFSNKRWNASLIQDLTSLVPFHPPAIHRLPFIPLHARLWLHPCIVPLQSPPRLQHPRILLRNEWNRWRGERTWTVLRSKLSLSIRRQRGVRGLCCTGSHRTVLGLLVEESAEYRSGRGAAVADSCEMVSDRPVTPAKKLIDSIQSWIVVSPAIS